MRDIHEVLRRKQAKMAQLQKQIEVLQLAAPLLTDGDEIDTAVLAETEEETQQRMSRLRLGKQSGSAGLAAITREPVNA